VDIRAVVASTTGLISNPDSVPVVLTSRTEAAAQLVRNL